VDNYWDNPLPAVENSSRLAHCLWITIAIVTLLARISRVDYRTACGQRYGWNTSVSGATLTRVLAAPDSSSSNVTSASACSLVSAMYSAR
jgi:hypothetical protein